MVALIAAIAAPLHAQTRFAEFPSDADRALLMRVIAAEDARATTPTALAPIRQALDASNPALRRFAVRSIGRLERPSLLSLVTPLLADTDAAVRAAAAVADWQMTPNDRAAAPGRRTRYRPRWQDTAALRRGVLAELADPAPLVRFRAIAVYDRRLRATDGCAPLMLAARDLRIPPLRLTAIDALGSCRPDFPAARLLDSIAGTLGQNPNEWHRPRARSSRLAGAAPVAARRRFDGFLADTNFFVRTYVARAALGGCAIRRHF